MTEQLNMYTMKQYSAMERNEFESAKMKWINLEPVIQSKVKKENKYCIFMHIYGI